MLKINAKLGGQHSLLAQTSPQAPKLFKYENQPFMVIGADVTHPMGFNRSTPSIASVVASIDRYATRYAERSRLQGHRVEMIQVSIDSSLLKGHLLHSEEIPDVHRQCGR